MAEEWISLIRISWLKAASLLLTVAALKNRSVRLQSGVLELSIKKKLRAVLSAESQRAVEAARHGKVSGPRHGKKKAVLELKAARDHIRAEVLAGSYVVVKG